MTEERYLAVDTSRFNEQVVIKEFVPLAYGTKALKKAEELFEKEAQTLYNLDHPQIPKFRAIFREDKRIFLVQDYVTGNTYHSLLQQRKQFTEPEILEFLHGILPVLMYLHNLGVIHRDISPDNIILRDRDRLPVLIDLGGIKAKEIAAQVANEQNPSPLAPTVLGKPGYAPPEQMRQGIVDYNSDLYALAVTVIVLMTGKTPQQLIDPATLDWTWEQELTLSPRLQKVLKRMLAPIPSDRFQSSSEVKNALPPPLVPSPTPIATGKFSSRVHRRKTIKRLLVVAGLVIIAVVGGQIIPKLYPDPNSSIGRSFLDKNALTSEKQAGSEAFRKGDYQKAIAHFQAALNQNPNDQETRIYLENAKGIAKNPVKIAAVVPMTGNISIAREMLRGVGLLQSEINQKGGINGRFLQVAIVNDDNNPGQAKQVAQQLVKDGNVLAVIGHNASTASLAAVPIYQQSKLLMASPTSFSDQLSNYDNVVRTIPPVRSMVEPLVTLLANSEKTYALVVNSAIK